MSEIINGPNGGIIVVGTLSLILFGLILGYESSITVGNTQLAFSKA